MIPLPQPPPLSTSIYHSVSFRSTAFGTKTGSIHIVSSRFPEITSNIHLQSFPNTSVSHVRPSSSTALVAIAQSSPALTAANTNTSSSVKSLSSSSSKSSQPKQSNDMLPFFSGNNPLEIINLLLIEDCVAVSLCAAGKISIHAVNKSESNKWELKDISSPVLNKSFSRQSYATCMCLNERGPPDWMLCVGYSNKKVILYSISNLPRTFHPTQEPRLTAMQEINHTSIPKSLAWYENSICLGCKSSCSIVTLKESNAKDASTITIPIDIDPIHGPLILPLPEGKLLVSSVLSMGVIIDLTGMPVGGALVWSSRPIYLTYCRPYIISLLENGVVEVVSLAGQQPLLIKSYELPGAFFMSPSNPFGEDLLYGEAASANAGEADSEEKDQKSVMLLAYQEESVFMYSLKPVSWKEQVISLLEEGKVDEAFSLFESSIEIHSQEQYKEDVRKFNIDAGSRILRKGDNFEQAFHFLSLAEIDPREILVYTPELLIIESKNLLKYPPHPSLLPGFLFKGVNKLYENTLDNLVVAKNKDQSAATSEMKDSLVGFLEACHVQLRISAIHRHQAEISMLEGVDPEYQNSAGRNESIKWKLDEDAYIAVENALARLYVDIILTRYEREDMNKLNAKVIKLVSDSEKYRIRLDDKLTSNLERAKMYQALSLIYLTSSMPDKALDIWANMGIGKLKDKYLQDSIKFGVDETISYLIKLSPEMRDIVFSRSTWIISNFPSSCLPIFMKYNNRNSFSLSKEEVLGHLKANAKSTQVGISLSIEYLEWLSKTFTYKLLSRATSLTPSSPMSANQEAKVEPSGNEIYDEISLEYIELIKVLYKVKKQIDCEQSRERFNNFLDKHGEQLLDPRKLLEYVNNSGLYSYLIREIIKVHGLLGEHDEAIQLLSNESDELKEEQWDKIVEEYCSKWPSTKFKYLQELLKREKTEKALKFLSIHGSDMRPVDVLHALPGDLPLSNLLGYFETMFRHTSHRQRTGLIQRNMEKKLNLEAQFELHDLQKKSVVVTTETRCVKCGRLILNNSFTVFNGRISHLNCP